MSKKPVPTETDPDDAARAAYIEAGLSPATVDALMSAERERLAQAEVAPELDPAAPPSGATIPEA